MLLRGRSIDKGLGRQSGQRGLIQHSVSTREGATERASLVQPDLCRCRGAFLAGRVCKLSLNRRTRFPLTHHALPQHLWSSLCESGPLPCSYTDRNGAKLIATGQHAYRSCARHTISASMWDVKQRKIEHCPAWAGAKKGRTKRICCRQCGRSPKKCSRVTCLGPTASASMSPPVAQQIVGVQCAVCRWTVVMGTKAQAQVLRALKSRRIGYQPKARCKATNW